MQTKSKLKFWKKKALKQEEGWLLTYIYSQENTGDGVQFSTQAGLHDRYFPMKFVKFYRTSF